MIGDDLNLALYVTILALALCVLMAMWPRLARRS